MFGPDGLLYVASYLGNEVVQFNVTTGASRVFCTGELLKGPEGLAFLDDGTLLATSHFNNIVVAIDTNGEQVHFFCQLCFPVASTTTTVLFHR